MQNLIGKYQNLHEADTKTTKNALTSWNTYLFSQEEKLNWNSITQKQDFSRTTKP